MILPPESLALPEDPGFVVEPGLGDVVQMFMRVLTQWRTGPQGYIGLDYNVVLTLLGDVSRSDRELFIDRLSIMEATWLAEFRAVTTEGA